MSSGMLHRLAMSAKTLPTPIHEWNNRALWDGMVVAGELEFHFRVIDPTFFHLYEALRAGGVSFSTSDVVTAKPTAWFWGLRDGALSVLIALCYDTDEYDDPPQLCRVWYLDAGKHEKQFELDTALLRLIFSRRETRAHRRVRPASDEREAIAMHEIRRVQDALHAAVLSGGLALDDRELETSGENVR